MPVIYRAVIEKPLLMFLSAIVDVRKKMSMPKFKKWMSMYALILGVSKLEDMHAKFKKWMSICTLKLGESKLEHVHAKILQIDFHVYY